MKDKRKLFITLGIIIILIPFLGVPTGWKHFFSIIVGLWILSSAYFFDKTPKDVVAKILGVRIERKKKNAQKDEPDFLFKEEKHNTTQGEMVSKE